MTALPSELVTSAVKERDGGPIFACQATRLYDASSPLPWWDVRQYVRDLSSGNVGIGRFLRVAVLRAAYHLRSIGFGYRLAVRLHDIVHRALTGRESPFKSGVLPDGKSTPTANLGLQPGEVVRVKPLDEIRKTMTVSNFNRGMRFDPEMARFCGVQHRIARRVERIIDEASGRMLEMKSPCIVLEGAVCSSEYSAQRVFCPRAITPYFREIWLERVSTGEANQPSDSSSSSQSSLS
jgi:hypothetical protein